MSYEQRAPVDYLAGTLSTAAAISDTALSSASFAALPATFTSTKYLPLVLHDPSAGLYEVVWVTAHTAASTSVTAVRAREGSTARAWPTGTHIVCSPTLRDVVGALALANLPTDSHIGQRVVLTDKSYVAEKVSGTGRWENSVGAALADHIGPRRGGSNPPADATILVRAGHVTANTNLSSQVDVTYRSPFANQTIAVMITPAGPAVTLFAVATESATGFSAEVWKVSTLSPYVTVKVGLGYACQFNYVAIGY